MAAVFKAIGKRRRTEMREVILSCGFIARHSVMMPLSDLWNAGHLSIDEVNKQRLEPRLYVTLRREQWAYMAGSCKTPTNSKHTWSYIHRRRGLCAKPIKNTQSATCFMPHQTSINIDSNAIKQIGPKIILYRNVESFHISHHSSLLLPLTALTMPLLPQSTANKLKFSLPIRRPKICIIGERNIFLINFD